MKLIQFLYSCSAIGFVICQSNNNKGAKGGNIFWPPLILGENLDQQIITKLASGCTKTSTLNQNPMFVVMVAQTENGFAPKPSKFVQMSTKELIDLNIDCDDCNPNLFQYQEQNYNAEDFQCKTVCIFMAAKKSQLSDVCKNRENFEIGVNLQDKYLDLMEACHSTENTNLTVMRNTVYRKLGFWSRKIQSNVENCRRKCMPICMQPLKNSNNNDDSEDDVSPIYEKQNQNIGNINNNQFADQLVNTICKLSQQKEIQNSLRSKESICNDGNARVIQISKILVLTLIMLVTVIV